MTSGFVIAGGGLGLFLLGMVIMTRGLKDLTGETLRNALSRFTKSPLSGAITGATTTAIVQSSSATTVTAVGFVGAGLLSFSAALGIIFGANIGTTATGWLVAIIGFKLQIGEFAFPLLLLGVLMHMFLKRTSAAVGLAVAGFALIFVGIDQLQRGLAGLEGIVTPETFPGDTAGGRLLLVLIGAAITLVTQSSSAGVATALTALSTNTISFAQAAAMVIGMDVGTTVTAAVATLGGSVDARRTGYAHVIYNLMTGTGALIFLSPYVAACNFLAPDFLSENPQIALVTFHTLFNTLGVIMALPFTTQFAKLIVWLVPEKPLRHTERLDPALYESPAVAIEATQATLRQLAVVILGELGGILQGDSGNDRESTLNETEEALKSVRDYLTPIDTSENSGRLYLRHLAIIHTIDHLRRLIDRCTEGQRHLQTHEHQHPIPLQQELLDAVTEALEEFDEEPKTPSKAQQVWRHFETRATAYRHSLIEKATRRSTDADVTIERLDRLRWARHVAYHTWRIVHYIRCSQSPPLSSIHRESAEAFRINDIDSKVAM